MDSKLLDEKPILIVDGNFISSYEKNNGWFLLRKDDIRELKYMVDTSSVKLYGVRGKNGAILINTKLLEYKSKPNNEKSIFVLDGKVISYSEYKKIDFSNISGIATFTDKATIILYGSEKNTELIYITSKIPAD
ncbi:hypothetical protein [Algibacter marinivivus]|nr:hypothetical protein [Algibacter marinivivus]